MCRNGNAIGSSLLSQAFSTESNDEQRLRQLGQDHRHAQILIGRNSWSAVSPNFLDIGWQAAAVCRVLAEPAAFASRDPPATVLLDRVRYGRHDHVSTAFLAPPVALPPQPAGAQAT